MRDLWTHAGLPIGLAIVGASLCTAPCAAQTAPQPAPAPAAKATASPSAAPLPSSLDALAWLRGCWLGSANRREFLEQWSAPRGGMMVGFSHTVVAPKIEGGVREKLDAAGKMTADRSKDKTQDFEYLRLEQREDGLYYVAVPSGKKEVVFRLGSVGEDNGAAIFTFTNLVDEFPQRLIYRRGAEGWLYAQVAGKPGAAGGDTTYPMRHIDCATSAFLKE